MSLISSTFVAGRFPTGLPCLPVDYNLDTNSWHIRTPSLWWHPVLVILLPPIRPLTPTAPTAPHGRHQTECIPGWLTSEILVSRSFAAAGPRMTGVTSEWPDIQGNGLGAWVMARRKADHTAAA